MSKTFRIVHELEKLNEAERNQYAADASVYFGLDPELGGLDFIWMNNHDGNGFRKLVLYARRGITDILRDKHGISVKALTQTPINGSLATTATGEDNKHRQEIAVGSHYIEGLTGKALDDAIMTSQTRALRRLTLQFVGGGILDESEVGGTTIHTTGQPATAPPQPTIQPSNAPGKDVTSREEVIAALNDAIEPKKRKTVPRRSKVDFGPSEPPPTSAKTPAQQPAILADIKTAPVATTPAAPIVTPEIKADILPDIQPAKQPARKLSPEVSKPYRARMFKLVLTLEKPVSEGGGGFEPNLGVGNSEKMRLFAHLKFPDINTMAELTTDQWNEFLSELEDYYAAHGAVATVAYIEKAIGL